ncbi:DUF4835 family protein [Bacteroides sp. OF04-15BH]|jgi:hypothetical protein|uniref:type IX secretion system protein PorD n=1 Tax=Bacteroides sp. OF04-15BH TaxID=2292281 RepID=UPI000E4A13DE|nr:DUF4835 family protein [Bacteroides sp. OF04-15BH]
MKRRNWLKAACMACLLGCLPTLADAQELNARITVNHSQISTTRTSIFEALEKNLTRFMNERQWTGMKYQQNERINCTFSITISQYKEDENLFTAQMQVQSTRPVFNSTYTTTVFSMKDNKFNFNFQEFDQLNFMPEQMDNNLTAMMAYYAYLIIGMDMDTMAPLGGTEVLRQAESIVTGAQNLGFEGWKAYDDNRNRFAIINDYLDGGMEPFRQMQYQYYRNGLDIMADQVDQGRAAITEALTLLQKAHENKALSQLPQIFTDYKRDEIVNIYSKKGTSEEKQKVYDIVFGINASQSNYWDKIKQ